MGQPMDMTEGMAFANSSMHNSQTQKNVIAFQQKMRMKTERGNLSDKHWNNFLRRQAQT